MSELREDVACLRDSAEAHAIVLEKTLKALTEISTVFNYIECSNATPRIRLDELGDQVHTILIRLYDELVEEDIEEITTAARKYRESLFSRDEDTADLPYEVDEAYTLNDPTPPTQRLREILGDD